ncbi:MAG: Crp/Fnr family transcriptional regulator [Alphaproteobacteria bacterium]|nr:Crp/Fnr family transcriptional regulator [Alphaproteobacteria bacterium]
MRSIAAVPCDLCPVRGMPLFRPFSPPDLALVSDMKTGQRMADPGTEIVDPAESGRVFFTIFDGWAYRYRENGGGRQRILDLMLPGDSIGLDGVLLGTPPFPVRALTALNLCVLDASMVERILATRPAVARSLMADLAQALRRADERLWRQRSGPQRCGYLILETFDRLQRRGLADAGCPFPLQRRHMAAMLGMSGTHVARSLAELRGDGLASIADGMLMIHDRSRLETFAGYVPEHPLGQTTLL